MEELTEEPVELVARVCAVDIGKAGLVVCVRVPHETRPGRRVQEVREYAAVTPALLALADWLRCQQVELVAMEATSDYWKPVFYLLEAEGFTCWLLNAKHVKNVPGRPKTDKLDAVWLAKVVERGMCRPSLVHPKPIRRLRDVTRYRRSLVREQTREKLRLEKILRRWSKGAGAREVARWWWWRSAALTFVPLPGQFLDRVRRVVSKSISFAHADGETEAHRRRRRATRRPAVPRRCAARRPATARPARRRRTTRCAGPLGLHRVREVDRRGRPDESVAHPDVSPRTSPSPVMMADAALPTSAAHNDSYVRRPRNASYRIAGNSNPISMVVLSTRRCSRPAGVE